MKIINRISTIVLGACIAVISLSSCNDSKSYAERLVDETKAVNYYLSDFRVENSIPENNEFELGRCRSIALTMKEMSTCR